MAHLIPSIPAVLSRRTGFTAQGRSIWGVEVNLKVAIVTLRRKAERSSVRADSSASRGRAEESQLEGVVLVPPGISVDQGDRLRMLGADHEVTVTFPRYGLDGALGHTQIELKLLNGE